MINDRKIHELHKDSRIQLGDPKFEHIETFLELDFGKQRIAPSRDLLCHSRVSLRPRPVMEPPECPFCAPAVYKNTSRLVVERNF